MSEYSLETKIDRESYIPLYIQVIDALNDYVESNKFPPGHQLPGEAELCRTFDVSRTVIRQALQELEYKGLIYRSKGRGTFVAEPKIHESLFQELTGFYQDMEAKGHRPKSTVLKQEKVPATKMVAAYLEIEEGADVIQIDRLRFIEDEPIVLVTTYLPFELVPELIDIDLAEQSLYAYLENEHGIQIARGKRFLEAVPANQLEAELLKVDIGSPLILLDSISYLADGTPLEYYHALHRGDRSRFEVDLIRVSQPGDLAQKLMDVSSS
ncbi:MAG: GntR family transcriptional regulator [Chloroflexi bacterium]|nr:MAG: GntR family transcriptional regulator [Chloroflexota bacterium]MBL1196471.1 GntR family transcriptional regulator [Chloroflexota bacterium]NOH13766.1 GntR family transcriptional regulator [Chloroflexota bacterium]